MSTGKKSVGFAPDLVTSPVRHRSSRSLQASPSNLRSSSATSATFARSPSVRRAGSTSAVSTPLSALGSGPQSPPAADFGLSRTSGSSSAILIHEPGRSGSSLNLGPRRLSRVSVGDSFRVTSSQDLKPRVDIPGVGPSSTRTDGLNSSPPSSVITATPQHTSGPMTVTVDTQPEALPGQFGKSISGPSPSFTFGVGNSAPAGTVRGTPTSMGASPMSRDRQPLHSGTSSNRAQLPQRRLSKASHASGMSRNSRVSSIRRRKVSGTTSSKSSREAARGTRQRGGALGRRAATPVRGDIFRSNTKKRRTLGGAAAVRSVVESPPV